MLKNKLEKIIREVLVVMGVEYDGEIDLSAPPKVEMGDFAFGCFPLAGILKKSPNEVAEQLVGEISGLISENSEISDLIESAKAMGPYVNFKIINKQFADALKRIIDKGDDWGKGELFADKLFLAEHTDANLFKEFHIGHLMTNSIGESLGRIAGFLGADVKQVTFQGDVGLHVAKTLYGMKNHQEEMPTDDTDIWERQKFLGKCYTWGEKQYSSDDNKNAKKEIIKINKKVYSREDEEQNRLYEIGKKWSLEYFEEIYKIVGSKFNYYFLESETFAIGKKLVKENVGKIFERSQGAIIFPGSKYGLHDRVFINSEDLPTYEAKDIGLFYKKWEKYNPDISLTITDSEQKPYFAVVKKAAGMINKEWEEKTVHLAHGTLRLDSGKMSSRTGDIIRAKKWIEDTAKVIFEKMNEKNDEVAKKVAISAIKYSILKVQAGKNIVYNQKEALSFEGDTGPYLQYTYVRAKSVIRKQRTVGSDQEIEECNIAVEDIPQAGKTILDFPQVVEKSLATYSPHHIATYLHKLASEFNSFYAHTKILDEKNSDYQYNINLTKAVAQTIKNGLYLLGIEIVEKM